MIDIAFCCFFPDGVAQGFANEYLYYSFRGDSFANSRDRKVRV